MQAPTPATIITTAPNLPAMMFALARLRGDAPAFRHHAAGAWHTTTWSAFARRTAAAAHRLRALGVMPGDRVLLCSEGRPEVPVVETALMALRAVPVPAYTTNTPEDHAHLLLDSGARLAIAASKPLEARIAAAATLIGGIDRLLSLDSDPLDADPAPPDAIEAEAAIIPGGALACLIYTSGTSGLPRGTMLPHRAILSNIQGVARLAAPLHLATATYLSFLPLAHSFEHTVGTFLLPAYGTVVTYGRGVEHLAADLATVRPTLITAVPRILEVVRARIMGQLAREKPYRQRLFHAALAAGLRRVAGQPTLPDRLLALAYARLVAAKVQARFGGQLRAIVSGGARLEPATADFFTALGVPVLQGYGQTEAGPVVSCNPPARARNATVGPALDGVAIRIADDGEILLQGDLVMDGYWNQPGPTAAALQDGWLHTGDVGSLGPEGYLTITDRKKDIIVLSGGENVSPARIEALLIAEPEIAQAVVSGEGQSGLSALLVPADGADAATVAAALARVNLRLSTTERIRRHALVPPFTIENGLLTASHKIKRAAALRTHAAALQKAP